MNYISPESNVYQTVSVVLTSEYVEDVTTGNSGSSGGIQLPFIPG